MWWAFYLSLFSQFTSFCSAKLALCTANFLRSSGMDFSSGTSVTELLFGPSEFAWPRSSQDSYAAVCI